MAEKKETNPIIPEIEETVTVRIPKDRNDPEDKVVWVNDRRFLIKKGENVDVPKSVYLVLQEEEKALETIFEYEEKVSR